MAYMTFLGTSGTRTAKEGATCIRVSERVLIDAGHIVSSSLGREEIEAISDIFLTHAHLDHVCDIPFIAEERVVSAKEPLRIHATRETILVLRSSLFNDLIWPDFSRIPLVSGEGNTIEFHTIETNRSYEVGGVTLIPIETEHTPGSCGYVVRREGGAIFVTGDTYRCDRIWRTLERDRSIHTLCIDISFASSYESLAKESKHYTPRLLAEDIASLSRSDVRIFPMHLKPFCADEILEELKSYDSILPPLHQGDKIPYAPNGEVIRYRHLSERVSVEELSAILTALSSEKSVDRLLALILSQAKKVTGADGGTLYWYNASNDSLEFKVVRTDSLGIEMGGEKSPISWEPLPLHTEDGVANEHMVAAVCALEDRIVNIEDVYAQKRFDFSGTKRFDEETGYRSRSMLVIPLKNHEDDLIGVLQLINKIDSEGNIVAFDKDDEVLVRALSSEAAAVLTKQKLIEDLESLLESFLHSINVAIENKSPYTAGHIEKMVKITEMITDAIDADRTRFVSKKYDEESRKEILLAALMHDVGKIGTPEYVVDKATKLQTIYDRIEAVKLKAEIRKKEAYIAYLESEERSEKAYRAYCETLKRIDDDIAFLMRANEGSEYFDEESVMRVKEIAHAQIEIGGRSVNWLSEDEVENLSVRKGTLTSEEREIINKHAQVSLEMLKPLPFPKKYARVPQIAGAHHEQLNGKGYPLGLKEEEISFEARILAIADIFEALTASDRPYKKAKRLSEAMTILFRMALENHIDKEIVLFIYESGLYRCIASEIMPPELIDDFQPEESTIRKLRNGDKESI